LKFGVSGFEARAHEYGAANVCLPAWPCLSVCFAIRPFPSCALCRNNYNHHDDDNHTGMATALPAYSTTSTTVTTKQNKTKQNKTKQNKTKQNKTKQNKTKQNNHAITLARTIPGYRGLCQRAKSPVQCDGRIFNIILFVPKCGRRGGTLDALSRQCAFQPDAATTTATASTAKTASRTS
jgi:hypothetical protein